MAFEKKPRAMSSRERRASQVVLLAFTEKGRRNHKRNREDKGAITDGLSKASVKSCLRNDSQLTTSWVVTGGTRFERTEGDEMEVFVISALPAGARVSVIKSWPEWRRHIDVWRPGADVK